MPLCGVSRVSGGPRGGRARKFWSENGLGDNEGWLPRRDIVPLRGTVKLLRFIIAPARVVEEAHSGNNNIVVFKTPHTPLTRKLGIQSEFSKLKRDLQRTLGNQVLDSVKAVVANPIDNCIFGDTYGMKFAIDTFPSS